MHQLKLQMHLSYIYKTYMYDKNEKNEIDLVSQLR